MLGILPALGAETAADVAGDDPHRLLWNAEDLLGQELTDPVGVLDIGVEGVAVLAFVVSADRATRFHILGEDAADDEAAF